MDISERVTPSFQPRWFNWFTFVNDGLLLPEIGEGWKFVDAIVLRQSFVVDLDEVHAERVGVVVDLLQLLQHFVARGAATGVCKARQK